MTVLTPRISREEAVALSSLYTLLAQTMRYPQPEFCNETLFDALETLLDTLGWQTEQAELRRWRRNAGDPLDELRTEYTRLFINNPARTAIPPYASVHIDGDHSLYGPTTERTRDFYRAHGYDLADDAEPADHLWIELDFLAALTQSELFAEEEQFLRELFRPWFACFREKSNAQIRHPFYNVSIQLIDFFTKEEP
ncbi:MAG: TorD/DmsD family molecular chaperone [Desulfobulbus sp.]|jgi:TorA maturation chaperone TorD